MLCLRRNIQFFWLIAYCAISPFLLFGQSYRYSFHHLTVDDGLSQSSNDFVYQDTKGFVWLSSIDGLNRFDGKQVKIYKSIAGDTTSLLDNNISSNFYEDEHSNLWFTTYEGIHCYVRKEDCFLRFQVRNSTDDVLAQDYHAFYLAGNQLWVRVGSGAIGKLYVFDIQKGIYRVLGALDGLRNFVVQEKKGNSSQIVSTGLRHGIIVQSLNNFNDQQVFFNDRFTYHANTEDSNNWYLSTKKGLVFFQYATDSTSFFDTYQNRLIGSVYSTTSINDSILLVATQHQSVLLFHKRQQAFIGQIPIEREENMGLHLKKVNTVHKDRTGNIWLTSRTSGVNYANLNKRKFDLPDAFIDQRIVALFESSRNELFCSYTGSSIKTALITGTHFAPLLVPLQLPKDKNKESIISFMEIEDEVWAITGQYLLQWDRDLLRFEYINDLPAYALYWYKDRNNTVWLATFSGIFQWIYADGDRQFRSATPLGRYQNTQATAIYQDEQHRIYLALEASKLVVLDAKGKRLKEIKDIGYANHFYEQEQSIWVATSSGVIIINKSDLSVERLHTLPAENYYCLLPDDQNNVWLSSNKGIICYHQSAQTYRRYTLADGLQGNEYNTNAFLKTKTGDIWMGGTDGLNHFSPAAVQAIPDAANVQLTRLQINDEPAPDSINIEVTDALKLGYQDNTLSFDFVGIDYSDPENVQLKYQMLGNDEDWIEAGNNGFARYSNLPFGDYTFQVKASNSDGIWNEASQELKIHIKRPWYRTWWFYMASLLSVSGLIYGIFMYRLQQALKMERLRVKISSDLHDDVGGLLSGLAMQSELLELTAAEDRKPKLQRISDLSRSAMSRMRDTVWAIDARKDKLENLLDRIREHAAETLTPKDIVFDLDVNELALTKNMPTDIRQNLYLICKEAITNAAKHSNGDRMRIQFKKRGRNGIELTIHDNGSSFPKAHKTTGLGMSNMQLRAEQIGGTLAINTENGFLIKLVLV
jgi:signal transduction histidine kinase